MPARVQSIAGLSPALAAGAGGGGASAYVQAPLWSHVIEIESRARISVAVSSWVHQYSLAPSNALGKQGLLVLRL